MPATPEGVAGTSCTSGEGEATPWSLFSRVMADLAMSRPP
jgi:hypothetical protein